MILVPKKVTIMTKTICYDMLSQLWFSTPTPPYFIVTLHCYFSLCPVFTSTSV